MSSVMTQRFCIMTYVLDINHPIKQLNHDQRRRPPTTTTTFNRPPARPPYSAPSTSCEPGKPKNSRSSSPGWSKTTSVCEANPSHAANLQEPKSSLGACGNQLQSFDQGIQKWRHRLKAGLPSREFPGRDIVSWISRYRELDIASCARANVPSKS